LNIHVLIVFPICAHMFKWSDVCVKTVFTFLRMSFTTYY
jgi:hypothetical protein